MSNEHCKETQRYRKRNPRDLQICIKNEAIRAELYYNLFKRSQLTLKFIRWPDITYGSAAYSKHYKIAKTSICHDLNTLT